MFRTASLAVLAALVLTATSFGDAFTTSATMTVDGNTPAGVTGVQQVDLPNFGGVAFTNVLNSNGTFGPNQPLTAIGGGLISNYSTGTGSPFLPGANVNNTFAVFALQGTSVVPQGGGLGASWTTGVLNIYSIGSNKNFGSFDPSGLTSGNAAWNAGTLIASYSLIGQQQVGAGPGGTPITTFASNTVNTGSVNPSQPNNGNINLLFQNTDTGSTFLVPMSTPNGLFAIAGTSLQNQDGDPFSTEEETELNALFADLIPGGFFSSPTQTFNPEANTFANGDVFEQFSASLYPVLLTSTITLVPEPTSMLLFGLVVGGADLIQRVRRNRKVQATV